MRSTRAALIALSSAFLASILILAPAAVASAEGTATVIHFTPEGLPALEAQLRKHEVHALTFHPKPEPGHVHVSMNDGAHYTVVYSGAGAQEHLIAIAGVEHTPVTVATVKAKPKATHHKLRYIAAGVLIVVIVVVAAVLLVDRRRKLREEAGEAASADAPAPPAP